jgi:hypothetical protein
MHRNGIANIFSISVPVCENYFYRWFEIIATKFLPLEGGVLTPGGIGRYNLAEWLGQTD